jgi:DMSO/TMAO reductase YedYZ molybdopterin-dependent catalytic subunit
VTGLQWKYGAAGNARWAGVRLGDLLRRAGLRSSAVEILLDGADVPVGKMPEFRRSIPVKKALSPDTLLAYEMNGEPMPVSHGFPLRLIVPGWAGDSWTKWVVRIEALDREYDGFFMKTAYRHPARPVAPGTAVDPAVMQPVTSLRVKSVIAAPLDGSRLQRGPVKITGAAWTGDGRPVTAVEVSTDAGRTWRAARFGPERSQYGWRLWEFDWSPTAPAYYAIMARASDGGGDRQPLVQEWNPSGYLWNVVHQVGVEVLSPGEQAGIEKPSRERTKLDLPENFKTSCLSCHEIDVIEQQRLTREQWDREIEKMMRWGAPVRSQDREHFLEFLLRHFGPRAE